MIVANRSSLSIYSETRTVAEITAALGIEPHNGADVGQPTRAALAGRALSAEYMSHQRTHWSFDSDRSLVDDEDDPGVGSLRALIEAFRGKADALRSLRPECDTVIWWSADSDNSQGTFVIPPDLLAELALLGCELRGTTFLDDDELDLRDV
ncbi:DUF4279 domain-containing protein [Leifsonia shinshuensis]|uniref:DUF4279 domain-containing protein n=1 Tax=Leifsonia shinshuensis TaxID=150026 RepID=UPI001F505E0C|nr:DUF4279 domain-containing protein [Leifsonia shinshuensis]MCI0156056.1 DUF4279 domain-containing protein [Leifsonia shinshuensis]